MPPKPLIVEFDEFDLDRVVADLETIRHYVPHRFEMEQLTAIVFDDVARHRCVGYKDVDSQEFWVRGHVPERPLMPGVLMCEVAAQLCTYHARRHGLMTGLIGLGGLEEVRFRGIVQPGDRLVMAGSMDKYRPDVLISCQFQGFVNRTLVCEGKIVGVALPATA